MPAAMPPINIHNIQLRIILAIIMAHMGLARTTVANNNNSQKLITIGGFKYLAN